MQHPVRLLNTDEIDRIVADAVQSWVVAGKRVLVLIPDLTRSCPVDILFRALHRHAGGLAKQLDFLVALGTHPALTEEEVYQRVGITAAEHRTQFANVRFFNHCWDDPAQLTKVGRLTSRDVMEISEGRFDVEMDVAVNRMVRDYDLLVIAGPVFPHEVIGFSGGNKYIFPGISGPDVLHFFHWLGAVITSPRIIGNKWTPVRRLVDKAASFLPLERRAFCMVVKDHGLAGLFTGTPEEAWSQAADLSAHVHVERTPIAYHTVLSCAPAMYNELWVGGKCMYKLEPAVADGGKLIIYAPHIHEVSVVHGQLIRQVGYHVRDYFVKQWDKFKHLPWGILAHSTHVRGIGTYEDGIERPRIDLVLATGIPPDVCREINLGYLDPRSINPADYQGREKDGVFYVPKAGEILYRWRQAPPELGGDSTTS